MNLNLKDAAGCQLKILAGCSATLRVFTEKIPKKIQKKFSKNKFQKKIPKKNKKLCLNSYACEKWGGGGLGPLV
jgi:hypothetical protein